jgi:hypothetical protein
LGFYILNREEKMPAHLAAEQKDSVMDMESSARSGMNDNHEAPQVFSLPSSGPLRFFGGDCSFQNCLAI